MANLVATDMDPRISGPIQPRPPACNAVSHQDMVGGGGMIDTGQYTLTLVATQGKSSGASVSGGLFLTAPQGVAHDSMGAAKASKAAPGRPLEAQYGATEVDITGVGAAVASDGASEAPSAHSASPERPGVLVWHRSESTHASPAWRLLIATSHNNRVTCKRGDTCWDSMPAEGPGAVLNIHKVDANGLAGWWHAVGATETGGYFCIAPVRYYSPYQSKYLPSGPTPH